MLLGLFDAHAPLAVAGFGRCRRVVLSPTAFLDHVPGYVQGDAQLFEALRDGVRWHAAEREMYERTVAVPRLLAGLPEDGPVHPILAEVSAALTARYRRPVDRIALALYRDGRDSVAFHGDRMGDRVADCVVAILSLRGPRRLRIRPTGSSGRSAQSSLAFDLGYGDLLVMGGAASGTTSTAYRRSRRRRLA